MASRRIQSFQRRLQVALGVDQEIGGHDDLLGVLESGQDDALRIRERHAHVHGARGGIDHRLHERHLPGERAAGQGAGLETGGGDGS